MRKAIWLSAFFVFVKFAESDCVFIFLGKWLQLAKK